MDECIDVGGDISLDYESSDLSSDLSDLESFLETDVPEDLSGAPQGSIEDIVDTDDDLPEDTDSPNDLLEPETEFLEDDLEEDLTELDIDETDDNEPDILEDEDHFEGFELSETAAPIVDLDEDIDTEESTSPIFNDNVGEAAGINMEEDVLDTDIASNDFTPIYDPIEEELSTATPLNELSTAARQTSDDGDLATASVEVEEGFDELAGENEMASAADQPDWNISSLTESEQQTVRDLAESGEIDIPMVRDEKAEPEHSELHLPDVSGEFLGEKGNSEFVPSKTEAIEEMGRYGRESVEYKDNYPDFSPFTTHESPWGALDCQVEIGHMTGNRGNGAWEFGDRPRGAGHDFHYDLGNFAQADNALLGQLRELNPNATVKDIVDFRKDNKLTWHECADGKTMQLVPTVIHDACRHSGGVSEMKYRMAMGDVTLPGND